MDRRDCRRSPTRIVIDDDDGIERELPTRWETCDVCDGKGTHVNPNIDRNGLTAEDFAEDPDFREDYFSGRYDVSCNRCGGRKVVAVVDEDACEPEYLKIYRELQEAEWQADADAEAERRYFERFER
jgi:hypothetical protein